MHVHWEFELNPAENAAVLNILVLGTHFAFDQLETWLEIVISTINQ